MEVHECHVLFLFRAPGPVWVPGSNTTFGYRPGALGFNHQSSGTTSGFCTSLDQRSPSEAPQALEKPPVPLQGLHAELQFSRYEGALSKSLEQQTFLAMFGRLCRLFFAAVSMEGTLWWTGVHDRLRCEPKDFTVLFRLSPPIVHERFISMTSLEQPCAPSTRRWGGWI